MLDSRPDALYNKADRIVSPCTEKPQLNIPEKPPDRTRRENRMKHWPIILLLLAAALTLTCLTGTAAGYVKKFSSFAAIPATGCTGGQRELYHRKKSKNTRKK